jgi:hypothetical protein
LAAPDRNGLVSTIRLARILIGFTLRLRIIGKQLRQLKVTPAMAAGVTDKLWEMDDLVAMLEQWELANFKPEYQFVVRQYAIGKGHSVSVMWRGGEVDTIFGFEKEADALQWIKEKSQAWLIERSSSRQRQE